MLSWSRIFLNMPNSCAACSDELGDTTASILCTTCKKYYHHKCVNLGETEVSFIVENRQRWICSTCSSRSRTLRSKSTTTAPVGSSQLNSTQVISVESFGLLLDKVTTMTEQLTAVLKEVRSMKTEQTGLISRIDACTSIIGKHSGLLEQHQAEIDSCKSKLEDLEVQNNDLGNGLTDLSTRVGEIDKILNDPLPAHQVSSQVDARVGRIEQKITALEVDSGAYVASTEAVERVKRSFNVILRGVPEEVDTIVAIREILKTADRSSGDHVVSFTRLGKKLIARPRLLRVTLSNPHVANSLLRNKNLLMNNPAYINYTISDDKTPQQQSEMNNLRKLLKRRQESGETHLTIRFIKGSPTIVSRPPGSPKNVQCPPNGNSFTPTPSPSTANTTNC